MPLSLAGARRRQTSLVEGGIGLFHVVTAMMLVASAVMVHAFVTGDYSIKYVQHYSNSRAAAVLQARVVLGRARRLDHVLGDAAGVFGSVAVYVNRERHRALIPWVVAIIAIVEMFFLFLMVVHNNPFETFLDARRPTARG